MTKEERDMIVAIAEGMIEVMRYMKRPRPFERLELIDSCDQMIGRLSRARFFLMLDEEEKSRRLDFQRRLRRQLRGGVQ